MYTSHLSAEQCGIEPDIDYAGNDVTGKSGIPGFNTVTSCKSFCQLSKYFTWDARDTKCYCKTSDSGRQKLNGLFSGRTNCQGKFD